MVEVTRGTRTEEVTRTHVETVEVETFTVTLTREEAKSLRSVVGWGSKLADALDAALAPEPPKAGAVYNAVREALKPEPPKATVDVWSITVEDVGKFKEVMKAHDAIATLPGIRGVFAESYSRGTIRFRVETNPGRVPTCAHVLTAALGDYYHCTFEGPFARTYAVSPS